MRQVSHKEYRKCLLLIKYIPIITLLMQLTYLSLYLIGIDVKLLIYMSGVSALQLFIMNNLLNVFQYCNIQRAIVIYTTITDFILRLNYNSQPYLLVIGIIILIILIYTKIIKVKLKWKYQV